MFQGTAYVQPALGGRCCEVWEAGHGVLVQMVQKENQNLWPQQRCWDQFRELGSCTRSSVLDRGSVELSYVQEVRAVKGPG